MHTDDQVKVEVKDVHRLLVPLELWWLEELMAQAGNSVEGVTKKLALHGKDVSLTNVVLPTLLYHNCSTCILNSCFLSSVDRHGLSVEPLGPVGGTPIQEDRRIVYVPAVVMVTLMKGVTIVAMGTLCCLQRAV